MSGKQISSATHRADDEFVVSAVPPFSLERTVAALRRRPSNLVETFENSEYCRMLTLAGQARLLAVRMSSDATLRVRCLNGPLDESERQEAAEMLDRMLGLRIDLAPIQRAVSADQRLARVMAQVPGMKPPRFDSLWTTLLCVVPFQQVSLDAGMSVLNRVVRTLGPTYEHAGRTHYGFPSAEHIAGADPDALRRCGLSQAKVRTLMGAAARIAGGELDEQDITCLDDASAMRLLTQLPGIGPWSAQIILLRGFRRLSIFPAGDSGAAGTLAKLFELDPRAAETRARTIATTLGPWKGYLYFLLLAWRLLQAGILTPPA